MTGVAGTPWYANHYFAESGGTPGDAQTAVATFWDDLAAFICQPVIITVQGEVVEMDETTGAIITAYGGADSVVAGGNDSLPMSTATQGLIRWTTGAYAGGRQIKGHTNVPFVPVGVSVDGQPGGAYRTWLSDAANGLIQDPDSELVIWSKKNGAIYEVLGQSVWTSFSVLRTRRD